jgi:hypothetical protein
MNLLESAPALAVAGCSMAAIKLLARWQARAEQADAAKPFQQEWEECGWRSLHRGAFQLFRIVPLAEWPRMEFTLQDERRGELARFHKASHKAMTIEFAGRRTQGRELLGQAKTCLGEARPGVNNAIEIRDAGRLIAEAFRKPGVSRTFFRLVWGQEEFQIEKRKWSMRSTNYVRCNAQVVGLFRRTGSLSRKMLFALRSDLPLELKVCMCSIAVLP